MLLLLLAQVRWLGPSPLWSFESARLFLYALSIY